MLESQVRTHYASLEATKQATTPSGRSEGKGQVAPASKPLPTFGPSYSTHVIAPPTLLAAQEARESYAVRRDDQGRNAQTALEDEEQSANAHHGQGQEELSEEEQRIVAKLEKADREVRAHERAHQAAGAGLTGPAHYTYTRGPDGKQYAVAGEVSIDTGSEQSATATQAKLEQVVRAALAPSDPSAQDLAVAAQARRKLAEVAQDAREERQQASQSTDDAQEAEPAVGAPSPLAERASRAYQAQGAQDDQIRGVEHLGIYGQDNRAFDLVI